MLNIFQFPQINKYNDMNNSKRLYYIYIYILKKFKDKRRVYLNSKKYAETVFMWLFYLLSKHIC